MQLGATIETIVFLLLVASLIGVAVEELAVPYTVGLVLAGAIIDLLGILPRTTLDPNVVLFVLLPPLLFEAAFSISWQNLRPVAVAVGTLATIGVVISAAITAGLLVFVLHLPWATAILFGVLVSATDPVAVVAFFRRAHVPIELRTLVEGESLLNDGTVIVVVTVLATFIASGHLAPTLVAVDILKVFIGGLAIGIAIGLVSAWLIGRTDNRLIETTLTLVVAYGSYLLADRYGVSGVLASVGAGSVLGNVGRRSGLSSRHKTELLHLWEFLAFVANSLVFLLLGISVDPSVLSQLRPITLVAVLATLVGRAIMIYGLGFVLDRLTGVPAGPWRHVLVWGGLRGALPVVVAYNLPARFGSSPNPRDLVLSVVVVSLLIQGLTLRPVVNSILHKVAKESHGDQGPDESE